MLAADGGVGGSGGVPAASTARSQVICAPRRREVPSPRTTRYGSRRGAPPSARSSRAGDRRRRPGGAVDGQSILPQIVRPAARRARRIEERQREVRRRGELLGRRVVIVVVDEFDGCHLEAQARRLNHGVARQTVARPAASPPRGRRAARVLEALSRRRAAARVARCRCCRPRRARGAGKVSGSAARRRETHRWSPGTATTPRRIRPARGIEEVGARRARGAAADRSGSPSCSMSAPVLALSERRSLGAATIRQTGRRRAGPPPPPTGRKAEARGRFRWTFSRRRRAPAACRAAAAMSCSGKPGAVSAGTSPTTAAQALALDVGQRGEPGAGAAAARSSSVSRGRPRPRRSRRRSGCARARPSCSSASSAARGVRRAAHWKPCTACSARQAASRHSATGRPRSAARRAAPRLRGGIAPASGAARARRHRVGVAQPVRRSTPHLGARGVPTLQHVTPGRRARARESRARLLHHIGIAVRRGAMRGTTASMAGRKKATPTAPAPCGAAGLAEAADAAAAAGRQSARNPETAARAAGRAHRAAKPPSHRAIARLHPTASHGAKQSEDVGGGGAVAPGSVPSQHARFRRRSGADVAPGDHARRKGGARRAVHRVDRRSSTHEEVGRRAARRAAQRLCPLRRGHQRAPSRESVPRSKRIRAKTRWAPCGRARNDAPGARVQEQGDDRQYRADGSARRRPLNDRTRRRPTGAAADPHPPPPAAKRLTHGRHRPVAFHEFVALVALRRDGERCQRAPPTPEEAA